MSDQTMQPELYKAPESNVIKEAAEGEYDESSMFKPSGRAGRLRYFKYSTLMIFVMLLIAAVVGGVISATGGEVDVETFSAISNGAAILLLPISFMFMIKRFHDIGWSGWWSLTMLVPLLNLIPSLLLLFMPGTSGPNRFGNPPKRSGSGVVWIVAALVLVAVIGILAAIAIPAYNGYVQAASEAGARQ